MQAKPFPGMGIGKSPADRRARPAAGLMARLRRAMAQQTTTKVRNMKKTLLSFAMIVAAASMAHGAAIKWAIGGLIDSSATIDTSVGSFVLAEYYHLRPRDLGRPHGPPWHRHAPEASQGVSGAIHNNKKTPAGIPGGRSCLWLVPD